MVGWMDDEQCVHGWCGSENVVDDTVLYHMVILSEKMWFYGTCVNKWLV